MCDVDVRLVEQRRRTHADTRVSTERVTSELTQFAVQRGEERVRCGRIASFDRGEKRRNRTCRGLDVVHEAPASSNRYSRVKKRFTI
jgi:hypothetical protein